MVSIRPKSANEILAVAFRIAQAAGWFLSARFILTQVGQNQYGFVSVMMSVAIWFQMFDFGITSYLRTELPKALIKGGRELVESYFKRGVASMALVAGSVVVLVNFVVQIAPSVPNYLMGVLSFRRVIDVPQFNLAVAGLSCYALMFICGNMLQAYLATFHRQYTAFILGILGCLVQPAVTWWAAAHTHNLALLFSVFCLTPQLPAFAYFVVVVGRALRNVSEDREFSPLNRTSASFLLIQFGGALAANLDLVIVSHFFGLKESALYSMFKLVVQFPISLHAQLNLQSWPIYSQLSGSPSDYPKLRELVKRNIRLAAMASVAFSAGLTLAGPWFVHVWSKGTLQSDHLTSALFSLYGSIYIFANAFNVLMLSFNYTKGILPFVAISPPSLIALVWLMRSLGPDAVILSNVIMYSLALAVGWVFYVRRLSVGDYILRRRDKGMKRASEI